MTVVLGTGTETDVVNVFLSFSETDVVTVVSL